MASINNIHYKKRKRMQSDDYHYFCIKRSIERKKVEGGKKFVYE